MVKGSALPCLNNKSHYLSNSNGWFTPALHPTVIHLWHVSKELRGCTLQATSFAQYLLFFVKCLNIGLQEYFLISKLFCRYVTDYKE